MFAVRSSRSPAPGGRKVRDLLAAATSAHATGSGAVPRLERHRVDPPAVGGRQSSRSLKDAPYGRISAINAAPRDQTSTTSHWAL